MFGLSKALSETKSVGLIFRDQQLSCNNSFADIAQYAIETLQQKSYPRASTNPTQPAETKHPAHEEKSPALAKTETKEENSSDLNVTHYTPLLLELAKIVNKHTFGVICTALSIELFVDLIKRYLDDDSNKLSKQILIHPTTQKPLNEQNIKLLMLTAVYQQHADSFTEDMTALGFDPEDIAQCVSALAQHNNSTQPKNIYQQLLHDAIALNSMNSFISPTPTKPNMDQLELRIKLELQKITERLELVKLCTQHAPARIDTIKQDLKKIVSRHNEIIKHFYQDDKYQLTADYCKTIILTIKQLHVSSYLERIELAQLVAHGIIDTKAVALIKTQLIELPFTPYELWSGAINMRDIVRDFLKNLIQQHHLEQYEAPSEQNAKLWPDKNGFFMRKSTSIADEHRFMAHNASAKKNNPLAFALGDFSSHVIFRPATRYIHGIPIMPYDAQDAAYLLLDPQHIIAPYQYKIGVYSNTIAEEKGNFIYSRTKKNRAKDLDEKGHVEKINAMESERCGEAWEDCNQRFGSFHHAFNEALTIFFQPIAIFGIGIENNMVSAIKALIWYIIKAHKKEPVQLFYFEEMLAQFIPIDLETLFSYSTLLFTKKIAAMQNAELQQRNISLCDPHDAYNAIQVKDLKNIRCSVEQHPPSSKHPIQYSFSNPLNPQEKLIGYVQNKIPVIEFSSTKRSVRDHRGLLPAIASQYQQQLLDSVDQLSLRIFLTLTGTYNNYYNIKISFRKIQAPHKDKASKIRLCIYYQPFSIADKMKDEAEVLCQLLGVEAFYKPSDVYRPPGITDTYISLRKQLPAILALTSRIKQISQRLNSKIQEIPVKDKQTQRIGDLKQIYLAFLNCLLKGQPLKEVSHYLSFTQNNEVNLTIPTHNIILPSIPFNEISIEMSSILGILIFSHHLKKHKFTTALTFIQNTPGLSDGFEISPEEFLALVKHCSDDNVLLPLVKIILKASSFTYTEEDHQSPLSIALEKAKAKQDYTLTSLILFNHIKAFNWIFNDEPVTSALQLLTFLFQTEVSLDHLLKEQYSDLILALLQILSNNLPDIDHPKLCSKTIQLLEKYDAHFEVKALEEKTTGTKNKHTALHYGVLYNNPILFALLCQRAQPNGFLVKNANHETPLDLALRLAKENNTYQPMVDILSRHISSEAGFIFAPSSSSSSRRSSASFALSNSAEMKSSNNKKRGNATLAESSPILASNNSSPTDEKEEHAPKKNKPDEPSNATPNKPTI